MRSIYDYPGKMYREYARDKRSDSYITRGTAALKLRDYHHNPIIGAECFLPYWIKLEMKQAGYEITTEELQSSLRKAKQTYASYPTRKTDFSYPYNDAGLSWSLYRPHDQQFNDFDCVTFKAIIDHKLTQEEEKELREILYVEFHDPYCDGRDCTGAPFTGYLQFLRCSDRTIVLHHVNFDV